MISLKNVAALALAATVGVWRPAAADLHPRGPGMVYDDVLNITWLANANQGAGSIWDNGFSNVDGQMTWENASAWAGTLVFGGYSDWRLPAVTVPDATCSGNPYADVEARGYTCTGSELGHLFHVTFSLGGGNGFYENPWVDVFFENAQEFFYWTGQQRESSLNPGLFPDAYSFQTAYGEQWYFPKWLEYLAWAVRDGDSVPPGIDPVDPRDPTRVPEPATMLLLGAGLLALGGARRRKS